MTNHVLEPALASELPRADAMMIMSADELGHELKYFAKQLKGADKAGAEDFGEDEWGNLISTLVPKLHPEPAIGISMVAHLEPRSRGAVLLKIEQVQRALKFATSVRGAGYEPTSTLLVPALFPRRFELLVGYGCLPVAWVQVLDVPRF